MNDLAPAMTDLKGKIEQLVKSHQLLKQMNDQLNAEIDGLKLKLEEQRLAMEGLEKTNRELASNKSAEQESMVNDTKLKINELVQEIDNCIALLNK
jgi:cell division septum initiation protein DivIVA